MGTRERLSERGEEEAQARPEAAEPGSDEGILAELQARERQLDELRADKARVLESSDRRLEQIEAQANAATERVAAAEKRLDEESAQFAERERDLEGRIAEAIQRAEVAEERAREAEQRLEATAHEARRAAASWLRDRTRALRREGKRDTEEHAAVEADRRVRSERDRIEGDAERRVKREVAEARSEAKRAAREAARARERELAEENKRLRQELRLARSEPHGRRAAATAAPAPPAVQSAGSGGALDRRTPESPVAAFQARMRALRAHVRRRLGRTP